MSETPKTPAERIAAANAKREALKAAEAAAHAEQQATDIEALVELEEKHGFERVLRIDIGGWKSGEGAATLVVVRIPKTSESVFKRHEQTISKAKEGSTSKLDSAHLLADTCLLYPSRETQKDLYNATMDLAPGLRTNIAAQLVTAAMGQAEEEKKG